MPDEREPTPRGSFAQRFVLGPQGLRSGWACLVFLSLLVAMGFLLSTFVKLLVHSPRPAKGSALPPELMLGAEFAQSALVLLATLIMARLEHRPFLSFGLRDRHILARAGFGLLSGFAAISLLVGSLWALGLLTLQGPVLSGRAALRDGLLWGAAFLMTGLFEELLLRGYLLFTLARAIRFGWSALLLSVAFGLVHGTNPGETPVGLFSAAAAGLLFSLSIWYTGSLWWAIGFHAAWDWGESFFWGTPDSGLQVQGHLFTAQPVGAKLWSGGAAGPEGSLLVFAILLLCAVLMYRRWHRKGGHHPVRESRL